MGLTKHVAVRGSNGERSGRDLPDPEVGRQHRASMGDFGPCAESGSSSAVLHHQADTCHPNQESGTGEYGASRPCDVARRNDQGQQDDHDRQIDP